MCNLKLDVRTAYEILRLHFEKRYSNSKVAKSAGVNRKTVSRILKLFKESNLKWPINIENRFSELQLILLPNRASNYSTKKKLPDMALIYEEMKAKGSTIQALHEEYLANNPNGLSYSRFCTHFREYKKSLKRSLRIVHFAGEKVFVDYAGPTITIQLSQTDQRKAQIFVGVLGASNYIYAEATWSQKREDWINSHVRMFKHFGGVPETVVCDNLKSGVSKASRKNPIPQQDYADMAQHFGTVIFPARAYKPQDKSKAEGGVLIIERWIMFRIRNYVFTSLAQLNSKISELLEEVNSRPFQKIPGNRKEAFERLDKPALSSLPSSDYVYREFKKVLVDYSYHIEVNGHYYSVPHVLVRKQVEAVLTSNTIEVLYQGKRVAIHARCDEKGKSTTQKGHMPDNHQKYVFSVDDLLDWAATIGENALSFAGKMIQNTRNYSFNYRNSERFKDLYKTFGETRLEAACQIVTQAGGNKIDAVESVLKNNIDLLVSSTVDTKQDANFDHENVRGSHYYD